MAFTWNNLHVHLTLLLKTAQPHELGMPARPTVAIRLSMSAFSIRSGSVGFTFLLGMLAALPAISTDISIPALLSIQNDLHAQPGVVGLTHHHVHAGLCCRAVRRWPDIGPLRPPACAALCADRLFLDGHRIGPRPLARSVDRTAKRAGRFRRRVHGAGLRDDPGTCSRGMPPARNGRMSPSCSGWHRCWRQPSARGSSV